MEDTLKTYYGIPSKEGGGSVTVRQNGSRPVKLAHHLRHSPTGFNWGYGGSGPNELARCLLLDAFGITDCPDFPEQCKCNSSWVEPNYNAFTSDVVSKWEKDADWKMGQLAVCEWVFDNMVPTSLEEVEVLA